MEVVFNQQPILLKIIQNITDYESFMAFMRVNKKCLQVAKYVIRQAPAIYTPNIYYETQASMKLSECVFDSLQELFINLHQAHLENPPKIGPAHGQGPWLIKNFAGPCDECLIDWSEDGCYCDDIQYTGITIVKYFHCDRPNVKITWKNIIEKPKVGFLMIKTLPMPYDLQNEFPREECLIIDSIDPEHKKYIMKQNEISTLVNYESMEYLYHGSPKQNVLRKLGVTEWRKEKWNRFYPATTEVIHKFDIGYYTEKIYIPDVYVAFD